MVKLDFSFDIDYNLGISSRGGAAKFGLISITYHKYIWGVYKYILRLEISIF